MLEAGDARQGTGLAGEMAAKMKELEPKFDVNKGYHMFDAMAQAVVEYLVANAEVSTTNDPIANTGTGTIS